MAFRINWLCCSLNISNLLIKELLKLGATRIGVFGAPPVGCLPSQRTLGGGALRVCAKDRNQASQLYNSKLSTKLDFFAKKLPHTRVVYLDIYHPLLDIIQHPGNYGNYIHWPWANVWTSYNVIFFLTNEFKVEKL